MPCASNQRAASSPHPSGGFISCTFGGMSDLQFAGGCFDPAGCDGSGESTEYVEEEPRSGAGEERIEGVLNSVHCCSLKSFLALAITASDPTTPLVMAIGSIATSAYICNAHAPTTRAIPATSGIAPRNGNPRKRVTVIRMIPPSIDMPPTQVRGLRDGSTWVTSGSCGADNEVTQGVVLQLRSARLPSATSASRDRIDVAPSCRLIARVD